MIEQYPITSTKENALPWVMVVQRTLKLSGNVKVPWEATCTCTISFIVCLEIVGAKVFDTWNQVSDTNLLDKVVESTLRYM